MCQKLNLKTKQNFRGDSARNLKTWIHVIYTKEENVLNKFYPFRKFNKNFLYQSQSEKKQVKKQVTVNPI